MTPPREGGGFDGDRFDGDTEPYRRGDTRREDPGGYEPADPSDGYYRPGRHEPRDDVPADGDDGDDGGAYRAGGYPAGGYRTEDGNERGYEPADDPPVGDPPAGEPTRRLRGAPRIGSRTVGSRARSHAPAIRAAVALLLAAVVLGGIALWGYRQLTGRSTAAPSPCPSGQTLQTAAPLTPALVRLRVTNGTSRSGLAGRTGDALRARRFVVLGVGNAEKPLRGPATIRYGTGADAQARLLALQLPAVRLQAVAGTPGTVELVLGSSFRRLRTPAQVAAATKKARTRGALPSPTASCR